MKALVFDARTGWEGTTGFIKTDVGNPVIHEGDEEMAIVKITYAGVCGSDRGIWFRESFRDMILGTLKEEHADTRVIGHEFFGAITALGAGVSAKYGFRVGDTVSAESHVTCGRCFQCRNGELHVCTEEKILGISINGGFAEYIKLPAKVLWLTETEKIRPEIACMQEPFGNAVHACSKVDVRGKRVAIFGCGPIGLFTVLIARTLGASFIICVEPNKKHAALARACGADAVIDSLFAQQQPWEYDKEAIAKILLETKGIGVDVAFEMAGYNSSVNNAIHAVRRGGDVILFGLKSGDFTIQQFDRMIVRGITLHSVIGRQIFKTWYMTKSLLEDTHNHIQEKLWSLLLQEGRDTIVPFAEYDSAAFEQKLLAHPKILLKFY